MVSFRQIAPAGALCLAALCAAQATTPTPEQLAAFGLQWETSQHASPDYSWYETPANFSDSLQPGVLLKMEYATNLTNYTVPGGLSMSRIIYTTLDAHDRVLPASAYILWPYHALPANCKKGYDVALWAHGTAGVFQPCAPSNYRSLQYHFMVPYLLGNQGMVVVAPDYAGLGVGAFANGTKIHHPGATSPANANDMAFALIAARAAFPQYLKPAGPFVAMGHSQGGRANWGFIERQAVSPVPGYRGAVLIAPAKSPLEIIENAMEDPTAAWAIPGLLLQPLTIDAVTTVYPEYNWAGFTQQALDVYHNAYEKYQVCLPTSNLLFGPIFANLTKPGWMEAPEVKAWGELTRVGNKEFAGPVLLISGNANGSDGIIPYDLPISSAVLTTVHELCDLNEKHGWGQSLQVVGFKNVTHFAVIQASEKMWLKWVKERFDADAPAPPSGCKIESREAFRAGVDSVQALAPNFLVEWVNATLQWQYTL